MSNFVRVRVLFEGNVQGVGFRYTTAQIARRHPVVGYVRNLPDGRVELIAEGEHAALMDFVSDIKNQMGTHIHNAQIVEERGTGEFPDFQIRH